MDLDKRTPLLLAASQNSWKSVVCLMDLGANLALRDSCRKNLMHIIVINGGPITDIIKNKEITVSKSISNGGLS